MFDELMVKTRVHASAPHYAAMLNPVEPMFMSMLIELQHDIDTLKKQIDNKLRVDGDGV